MARTVAGAAPGRANRRFLIVALLLACLSAVLVYAKISSSGGSDEGASAPGDQEVVVAAKDIPQNTTITAEMLQVKSIPLNAKIVGAFVSVDEAVGTIARFPINENQQVTSQYVVDTDTPSGAALHLVVPAGRRAISITASQVISAGGLVLPGDYVDIVWNCCADSPVITKTLLTNVQVLAVAQGLIDAGPTGSTGDSAAGADPATGNDDSKKPEADAVTLTLSLTPAEAQTAFLAEETGSLRASVRRFGDTELIDPGFKSILDMLPEDIVSRLPIGLQPDGYRAQQ